MSDILGGIFGAVGSMAAAKISADAVKDATDAQLKALEKQRKFVYSELDPSKIGGQSLAADRDRAQNRLALQGIVDPELLRQRYASQAATSGQLEDLLSEESDAARVAAQATEEALAGAPRMQEAKAALIDAALRELDAGATLPPDVQAELVQTGLQKSGRVTGGAGGSGVGGQLLTTILGSAGLQLQKERQERAAGLLGQAQNLEQSRASILGTLFPNLSSRAAGKLGAAQSVFAQANQAVPEAGLGGSDVANLWLARVGATNQLAQSAADAAARGGMAQAQILNQGIGQAIGYGAQALPSTAQIFGSNKSPVLNDWEYALGAGGY